MEAGFRAIDIADFYIQLANTIPGGTIDNLKINKLLYYTQGMSMIMLHRPIFSDDIQAWDYGPVVPEVYHTFKCCGKNIIEEPRDYFDESRLSPEELDLLINVYLQYSKYTGLALKEMSHKSGSPWRQVYKEGESVIIPLDMIADYFKSNETLNEFEINMTKIPVVTAIPSAWDSAEDSAYD